MKSFRLIISFVTVCLLRYVSAGSAGMGSCDAGIAAISGTHLDYGPTSASMREGGQFSFADSGLEFLLDGTPLLPQIPATFPANTNLTWTIVAGHVPYKGILVRVQSDEANVFTHVGVEDSLQNVGLCDAFAPENVVAVCHNSPAPKSNNSGVLYFTGEGPVIMDVSIVFDNIETSVYAFESFPLMIGEDTLSPPTNSTDDDLFTPDFRGRCNRTRGDFDRGGNHTGGPRNDDELPPGGNRTRFDDGLEGNRTRPDDDCLPRGNHTRFDDGPPGDNRTGFDDGPTGDNRTQFGNDDGPGGRGGNLFRRGTGTPFSVSFVRYFGGL